MYKYKQLLDIVLDEVNVKMIDISMGIEKYTGKEIILRYNGTYFYWMHGDERKPVKNEYNILKILENFFNQLK